MPITLIQSIIIASLIFLFPLTSQADEDDDQSYRSSCLNEWMQSANDKPNIDAYEDFGEKFCDCASKKILDSAADVSMASQNCLSQTFLNDIVNTIKNDVGLDKVAESQIQKNCLEKWKTIYTQVSNQLTAETTGFCQCTVPKITDISKSANNMTDKQFDEKVKNIAEACSNTLSPDYNPANAKTDS